MLLKPEPIFESIRSKVQDKTISEGSPLILLSPQGRKFNQKVAKELSQKEEISLICGRYEGFDERIRSNLATDEISIGDFVLSGGEIPAITIIDSVSRLLPGVISSIESAENDSFFNDLLQYPQYTRPAKFEGLEVPKVLLSGNHSEIEKWRRLESLKKTKDRRPDLLSKAHLTEEEQKFLDSL
jgi:tRNA (guanine37-N1)-methyltransferase